MPITLNKLFIGDRFFLSFAHTHTLSFTLSWPILLLQNSQRICAWTTNVQYTTDGNISEVCVFFSHKTIEKRLLTSTTNVYGFVHGERPYVLGEARKSAEKGVFKGHISFGLASFKTAQCTNSHIMFAECVLRTFFFSIFNSLVPFCYGTFSPAFFFFLFFGCCCC